MVIFDVNLSTGRWPFRPMPLERMGDLVPALQRHGVTGGLVRSSEAPFSADPEYENRILAKRCLAFPGFLPLPAVHPEYGFWRTLNAPAAAFYPGFHRYRLTDAKVLDMARTLTARGIVPVVILREEDERGQHPLCRVPTVPVAEVEAFAGAVSPAPVVVLNAYAGEIVGWKTENIYSDIAFAEGFPALEPVLPCAERLLFGSHAPFFCPGAAKAKLNHPKLTPAALETLGNLNAERIFL